MVLASLESLKILIQQQYTVDIANPEQTKQIALYKAEKIRTVINGLIRNISNKSAQKLVREGVYFLLYELAGFVDTGTESSSGVEHLKRVGDYAQLLAWHHITDHQKEYPNYDAEMYSRDLAKAAPLHDIGKVCLPIELLAYTEKFSESQREIMKVHVDCGRIILTIDGYTTGKETRIPLACRAAAEHHFPEYGTPVKNNSSLAGAIVKLVDSFDAGTSERLYDPAKPVDEVVDSIHNFNTIIYDSDVVATFLKHKEEFRQLHDKLYGHH